MGGISKGALWALFESVHINLSFRKGYTMGFLQKTMDREQQPRSPFKLLAYASIALIVCNMMLLITNEFFVDEPDGPFQFGDGFFVLLLIMPFLLVSACVWWYALAMSILQLIRTFIDRD